ncbi:MAG: hypothetical protein FWG13_02775 [Leptospirales bacterium]|nr:hypothetical protein [Leptospirales bacterium]
MVYISVSAYSQTISDQTFSDDFPLFSLIQAIDDKKVPDDFQRLNRYIFSKNTTFGTASLYFDDEVYIGSIGAAFETTNEAIDYNAQFYNYLEKNGSYVKSTADGEDIYFFENVYIKIIKVLKRNDGLIIAGIRISGDINEFDY